MEIISRKLLFKQVKTELILIIIGTLFGIITSILMILLAVYLTPDYVANNISSNGILNSQIINKINIIRIVSGATGIFGLLIVSFFYFKPYLFKQMFFLALGIHPYVSKFIATISVFVLNFLGRRFFVFPEAESGPWINQKKEFIDII